MLIDDEPDALELLATYVTRTPFLKHVFSSTNPLEGIDYLAHHSVDLIFLDVQMPELTGIDFLKTMPGSSKVILCTAHAEYAVEGFEHSVLDYLMKPVSYVRFLKAANKANEMLLPPPAGGQPETKKDFLFIKSDVKGKLVRLDYADIDYIESLRNYTAFYHGKVKTMAILNLKDLELSLGQKDFIRVHKSFIVPLANIKLIEGNFLKLKNNDTVIPIGGSYKVALLSALGISNHH